MITSPRSRLGHLKVAPGPGFSSFAGSHSKAARESNPRVAGITAEASNILVTATFQAEILLMLKLRIFLQSEFSSGLRLVMAATVPALLNPTGSE